MISCLESKDEGQRALLSDWIVKVHDKLNLKEETLYLTFNIIDRYFDKLSLKKDRVQLVGLTALMIASKYEEIYPPSLNKLIRISDN